jgi:hypothetical protein
VICSFSDFKPGGLVGNVTSTNPGNVMCTDDGSNRVS